VLITGLGFGDAAELGLAGAALGGVVLLLNGEVQPSKANAAAATITVARMAGSLMTWPQL
jgi:hypothetical protein